MIPPPKILLWLLDRFCPPSRQDLKGDFLELYESRASEWGRARASLRFFWDVFTVVPLRFLMGTQSITTSLNPIGMIQHFIKLAVRVLLKNPATSLISILGFTVAVGCTLTGFLYADFLSDLDSSHSNRDHIYQVVSHVEEESQEKIYGPSPILLGDHLSSEHSEVAGVVRLKYGQGNVRLDTKVFRERILFADPAFLSVFDFPLQQGGRAVLGQKENVVLNKELAIKYFGTDDPVSKTISIKLDNGVTRSFKVMAIFDDMPENLTFRPGIVLSIDNYLAVLAEPVDWSTEASATFVLLKNNAALSSVNSLLNSYRETQNEGNSDLAVLSFELFSLNGLGNKAEWIDQPIAIGNSESGSYVIASVGVLILVLACFNYLNLAVSSGTGRLKEIAIRKTLGGNRRLIIFQFLMENIIIVGGALLLGSALCYFLLLPGFNAIAPVNVPFKFSSPERAMLLYLSIWLLVSLLSGAYPALYISKYQPSIIFKGKQKFSQNNYLSKTLLGLQLMITFTAMVGSLIFTDNAFYVKNLGWGYDQEQLFSLRINEPGHFESLSNISESTPGILSVAGSQGHIGEENQSASVDFLDKQFKTLTYDVSPGYLETLKVTLLKGRFFEKNKAANEENSIVVNEEFVEKMGWEEAIGQQVFFQGKNRNVIGVIANVRHSYAFGDSSPMAFTSSKELRYNRFVVRYDKKQLNQVNSALETAFYKLAPDEPYNPVYQNELYSGFYYNLEANNALTLFMSCMTVLLSCLGLYGLMAFRLQVRLKEFGIRLALGATGKSIIWLVVKEYSWMVILGLLLGIPLGTTLIQGAVVDLLTISKPFSFQPVIIATVLTLLAITLTVLRELFKAARINPAETLRSE
ncbi:MAG: ABC transporter permease [Imperialibacter sp.]